MQNGIKLYLKFFSMHVKSQMQYKVSFIFLILGRFILSAGEIIVIFFLFNKYNSVQGFTVEDVLICAAGIIMSFAIA